jgi:hypothetical protein
LVRLAELKNIKIGSHCPLFSKKHSSTSELSG